MDSSQLNVEALDRKWWIHPAQGKLLFTISDPDQDEELSQPIVKFEHGPQVGSLTVSAFFFHLMFVFLEVDSLIESFKNKCFVCIVSFKLIS